MIVSGMNTSGFSAGLNLTDLYNMGRTSIHRAEIKTADQVDSNLSDGSVSIKGEASNIAVSGDSKASSDSDEYTKRETLSTKDATKLAIRELSIDRNLMESKSDIETLDVKKAISDMQADSMLKQYQFFVGNLNDEDGRVIRK